MPCCCMQSWVLRRALQPVVSRIRLVSRISQRSRGLLVPHARRQRLQWSGLPQWLWNQHRASRTENYERDMYAAPILHTSSYCLTYVSCCVLLMSFIRLLRNLRRGGGKNCAAPCSNCAESYTFVRLSAVSVSPRTAASTAKLRRELPHG